MDLDVDGYGEVRDSPEGASTFPFLPSVPSPSLLNLPLSSGCEDHWSWDGNNKSDKVRLHGPKHRMARFHPDWSNGTAGVRGTRVLNGGRFYWEIKVSQRIFGTSLMFGIGTNRARLHVDAYVDMLGEDGNSWGLSHKGLLWHGGRCRQYVEPFRKNVATVVGLYFDGVTGCLTFFKDNICLGVAFTGLQEVTEPIYPIVCSTAFNTEMALGVLRREFRSLQDRCRASILSRLTTEGQVDSLRLPVRMKQYVSKGLARFQEDVLLSVKSHDIDPSHQ